MSHDSPRPPAGRPHPAPRRESRPWLVAAGAAALVAAVWGSLKLSQTLPAESSGADAVAAVPTLPGTLPGFRADAFFLPDDSLLGFVEIPAGPFVMGSDPSVDSLAFDIEWWGDGRVQGTVDLPRFLLGRYEVTVAQYATFVSRSRHRVPEPRWLRSPPRHPVTFVAWTDAVAYARWLDGALRAASTTPPALARLLADGWRVTLPTEAQWEKAARGDDARIYPWGNEARRERANYRASSPVRVGSYECPECPHEVSDLSGNVWEWTRSPYQPYPYDESDDHESAAAEALWVMRGGSFGDTEQFIRAANRGGADPGARRPFIGFRVALTRD